MILEIGCNHTEPVQLLIAFEQFILHIQLPEGKLMPPQVELVWR